ncbi:glycosyltransferase family A protein [Neorhizobium sp. AL 9.2.2]|uniref:glycosyltransferase family 2 protein n=1 Tax=Neorhizobium sp. AL 9.2.2 TaxID=2712894 RepID=UPI001574B3CA|nr:glycosyltransferase family A protein [Neorhizobium sp. AL 9.2.2]NSY19989.1 glycosyltransferase family 2 protein [Neorhizobium sp. AL 9.2.2]
MIALRVLQAFRRYPPSVLASIPFVGKPLSAIYEFVDFKGRLSDFIADPYLLWKKDEEDVEEGPLVSVIIATRNDSLTIEKAVNSILRQTYKSFELIVVDDASDDGTREILERLSATDCRLLVLSNLTHQGTGRSRNRGLRHAKGRYVTFQDGDDTSARNRIALQAAAFGTYPHAKLVLCNYVRVDGGDRSLVLNNKRTMKCIVSMMFPRREVIEKIGFFREESVSEDADYYERIKVVFGPQAEIVVFRTLYRALFRRNSAFFSASRIVEASGRRLVFERSADAVLRWQEMQIEHSRMRDGSMSPLICPESDVKQL